MSNVDSKMREILNEVTEDVRGIISVVNPDGDNKLDLFLNKYVLALYAVRELVPALRTLQYDINLALPDPKMRKRLNEDIAGAIKLCDSLR